VAQEGGGLPELLDALRWRWKLLLVVVVPLVAGAAVYAESLPNEYQGRAILTVAPRPDVSTETVVEIVAPKYVAYLTAPATLRRLADELGEGQGLLDDALNASLEPNTGNILVTVTLGTPERAAEVANAFAGDVVEYAQADLLASLELVAPAVESSSPTGPPRRLIEAAALIVALLLGVALTVIVERSRPRMRSWRDIAVLTGYPMVGRLPRTRRLRRASPTVALADPNLGPAVRSLRTNLERELGGRVRGVVVVTSAVPGEGKTTISGVLATALARLDLRVLLIDGDLHRAGLSRNMPADGDGGLAGLLRRGGDLHSRVQPGWADRLSVLPTAIDPEPGDLLARGFPEVVRRARDAFDVVIVDSPTLLGTADAATLATQVDGVLLVVADGTMASPVSEAVLALHRLRVNVWGVVANRVAESPGVVAYTPASAS
jgi:capsular exopolysaccharide synthesis family protein